MRGTVQAGIILGLTAIDQAVKALTAHQVRPLISGVIGLHYTENRGFSLGLMSDSGTLALILSALVFLAVICALIRLPEDSALRIPMLMISAGALGNLIDRIFLGFVRDMLELQFIHFYIFNPADVFVTVGAFLCAVLLLRPERKEKA